MRRINRSAIVPYSPEQMFALVEDVESYPSFLPWCHDARIERQSDHEVEATLEIRRGGIGKKFRTRNSLQPPDSITLELVEGPFRSLAGAWTFSALGGDGCKVSLALGFEFESRLTDLLLGAVFEEICNSLVDAFTRRAHEIYGTRVATK
jgi:ribosome-associated toxin RatA of RatAB toxin-antitoxin module